MQDVIISNQEDAEKQDTQSLGRKICFTIEDPPQNDTGIYIEDAEEANRHNRHLSLSKAEKDMLLTEFKRKLKNKLSKRHFKIKKISSCSFAWSGT